MISLHVRFDKTQIEAIDRVIDPTIKETRSLFVREAVKEKLLREGVKNE